MRNTYLAFVLLVFAAYGCGDERRPLLTAPSVPPAGQPPPRLGLGNPITLGQAVAGRVTDEDPLCPGSTYRCKYFRLTVPADGMLVVTIRWNFSASYPFDLGVFGPSGPIADGQIGAGLERIARGRASGGTTYVIEVWSFLTSAEPFELTTSLEQR